MVSKKKSPERKKTRAEKNILWVEKHCRLPEGKFVGQKLVMADFMKDDFKAIYDNPHGTRRAIISRGRKNAKTTECAALILLHLCGPEYKQNSQLYSCAQSRDQAAIVFALAAKIVRLSPDLRDVIEVKDTAKELLCPVLGTRFKALSAETSTAFGLSPVLTIHDELGQVCRREQLGPGKT
jgi:phage terminase large subunit-like protein